MEKTEKERLIEFLDFAKRERLIDGWQYQSGYIVELYQKSINCLEAKPKALHSMKCDENNKLLQKVDSLVDRKDLLEKYVEHLANAILNDDIDQMIKVSASSYLNALDRTD